MTNGQSTSIHRLKLKEKVKAKAREKEKERRRKAAARKDSGSKTMAGMQAGAVDPGEVQGHPHTTDVTIRGPPHGTV